MCSKLEVIKEETFDEVKSDSEDSCDQAINGASDDDDLDEDSFSSEEESVDVSPPRSDLVGHCNDKSVIRPHETSKRYNTRTQISTFFPPNNRKKGLSRFSQKPYFRFQKYFGL